MKIRGTEIFVISPHRMYGVPPVGTFTGLRLVLTRNYKGFLWYKSFQPFIVRETDRADLGIEWKALMFEKSGNALYAVGTIAIAANSIE